ncbi:MAG: transglutaminase domain-containing protein [Phycisphaerales bacterium]
MRSHAPAVIAARIDGAPDAPSGVGSPGSPVSPRALGSPRSRRPHPVAALAFLVAWILCGSVAVARDAATQVGEKSPKRDLWYTLSLGGTHCGWIHQLVDERDGGVRSVADTVMKLDRGGQTVMIEMSTEFLETPDGRPLRMRTRSVTGPTPLETQYTFPAPQPGAATAATVDVLSRQGGSERRSTEPNPPAGWLPPVAADRFFNERATAGAAEIVYETIDGQSGLNVAKMTAHREGSAEFKLERRTIPVTVWRVASSLLPIETINHISTDGEIVYSSSMLGSQKLETRLSTREVAMRVRRGASPDVLSSTMVQLPRPIPDSLRSSSATYRLSATEGDLPDLPSAGAQRFERVDAGHAIVRELKNEPLPASAAEIADSAFRAPSPMIDFDDDRVKAILADALKGHEAAFAAETAERLRAYVNRFIRTKGLATAFATAGETARSREGDCSEHAVLLCALLRGAGVPARVAVGLVYADDFAGKRNVFAWHMWTQALIPEQTESPAQGAPPAPRSFWVDFDATLPGATRFHAAHILTGATALAEGAMDPQLAAIVPLLGKLRIEVVEVK